MTERDESPARKLVVFVVFESEAYEGDRVLEICKTKETAIECCEQRVAERANPKKHWKRKGDSWTCGIDTIEIEEWEVTQ